VKEQKTDILIYCDDDASTPDLGFAYRNPLPPRDYEGCEDYLWYHPFVFAQPRSLASSNGVFKARSMGGRLCYRGVGRLSSGFPSVSIDSFWPVDEAQSAEADCPLKNGADHRYVEGLSGVDSFAYSGDLIVQLPGYMIELLPDLLPKAYRAGAPKGE
jgi:hypothetical protein